LGGADGYDVDGDALVDLELVQALADQDEHLVGVVEIDHRLQVDVLRLVVAAGQLEARPRILPADRGPQLVHGPPGPWVQALGHSFSLIFHRASPPSLRTAATKSLALLSARAARTSLTTSSS